jgi:prefoldin alpha subunit
MEKENFEKDMLQLNLFGSKLQEIEQQLQIISKHISELQLTSLALQELEETKQDTEMLAPIGQNIFVKAKIKETEKVMVDLGSKVFAEKSLEDAQKIINEKIDEFSQIKEHISEQAQAILNAIDQIETKVKGKN